MSLPERLGLTGDVTGRGVTVAFIDSGFYPHPDLGERIIAHVDATDTQIVMGGRFGRPAGYAWHGQMTSVIAAGDGRTSGGRYRGIAPEARLVLIKVSTRRQQIKERDILRGLSWLIDNARRFGVRVVNVSVGGDAPSDDPTHPLHCAVKALVEQGITVVIAAGNSDKGVLLPPASAPEALTIGAYDDNNALDPMLWVGYPNSFGTVFDGSAKPECLALGRWVPSPILPGSTMARQARWLNALADLPAGARRQARSILWRGRAALGLTDEEARRPAGVVFERLRGLMREHKIVDAHHQYVDGTSVSAAVASGIVALMLEVNPRLTPRDIKAILVGTAVLHPSIPLVQQGAGIIQVSRALEAARAYGT